MGCSYQNPHPTSRNQEANIPSRELRKRAQVVHHLKANLPIEWWENITDTRDPHGKRYELVSLVMGLLLGLVTAQRTLTDTVQLLRAMPQRRHFKLTKVPSESTLWRTPQRLFASELRAVLRKQVRTMQRNKQLAVLQDIGISLVAIDGKVLATDDTAVHPQSMDHNKRPGGGPYLLRALRAVHVASAVKPALDQHIIPAKQGEANNIVPFVSDLIDAYGKTNLLRCISLDAGLTSRHNCHFIDEQGIGFIAGLKGDQPTLHEEALRLLGQGDLAPAGGWERHQEEVRGSRHVQLWFARTREMVDWHGWRCIRQVWRVKTRRQRGERVEEEDRYFVTNLPWGRLIPSQCLAAVRAHWGIENDSNWTLDVIWGEDKYTWCRQGGALEIMALLRLIAFNIIRLFRHRRLRSQGNRSLPYRTILKNIEWALITTIHPKAGFS